MLDLIVVLTSIRAESVPKITLNHACPAPINVKTKRKRHMANSVLRYF